MGIGMNVMQPCAHKTVWIGFVAVELARGAETLVWCIWMGRVPQAGDSGTPIFRQLLHGENVFDTTTRQSRVATGNTSMP